MKPLVRKIIVFSTLPAAIAFASWHFSSSVIDNQPDTTREIAPSPPVPVGSSRIGNMNLPRFSEAGWGRDPFVRLAVSDSLVPILEEKPQWILGGILYDDKAPYAVINRKIVKPGDTINGAKVVKIKRQSVTLEIDSVAFTLDMTRGKS